MMRDATNDLAIFTDGGDRAWGMSLGWTYCAEQERGLKRLERLLGVGRAGTNGIDRRRISAAPDRVADLLLFKDFPQGTSKRVPETRLGFGEQVSDHSADLIRRVTVNRALPTYSETFMTTCWDDKAFFIRAFGMEERQFLIDLHAAFLQGDVALGAGPVRPFGRSPLTLTIPSLMPRELIAKILEDDLAQERLEAAARDTGIADRLKSAGRGWYALVPHWVAPLESLVGREGKPSDDTRHPVIFYLNPEGQDRFNHGWFTVEELEAWASGTGPVVKTEVKAAR